MLAHHLHLDRVAQVGLVGAIPQRGIGVADLFPCLGGVDLLAAAKFLEHAGDHGGHGVEHVLLGDEAHFEVELVEIGGRAVGARILVAETGRDLEILVVARHHDQLLELLRRLRQGVELARMQPRRHEEVARAFGAGGGDDRGLEFAEVLRPHPLADRRHHIRPQHHVALHRLAAQVKVAVAQAGFLGIFLIAEHHQRQFVGGAQHLQIADEHLDLARRQLGVHKARIARLHHAVDAHAPFRPQLFHRCKDGAVGIAQHLCDAVMVAQVDEQDAAMVADAVHPARQANGFALVGLGQVGAGMAAIGMHVECPSETA